MISSKDIGIAVTRTLALLYALYGLVYSVYMFLIIFMGIPQFISYLFITTIYLGVAALLWFGAEIIALRLTKRSRLNRTADTGTNPGKRESSENYISFYGIVMHLFLFVVILLAFTQTMQLINNIFIWQYWIRELPDQALSFGKILAMLGYGGFASILFLLTRPLIQYIDPRISNAKR